MKSYEVETGDDVDVDDDDDDDDDDDCDTIYISTLYASSLMLFHNIKCGIFLP